MSNFCDLAHYLKLQQAFVSARQLKNIQTTFGDLRSAIEAKESDWQQARILTKGQLSLLFANDIDKKIEESLYWGEQPDQSWLTIKDARYPDLLQGIDDPPIILGIRGNAELLSDPQIAVVGSRNASKNAQLIAEDFASHLSKAGITITSGLALGIDAAAHRGGLSGQGSTVAVVATGLDRIYPAANQQLGRQVAEEGAMISEFPLGTKPLSRFFPQRNRIISGLSVGTLVVEAALKSGSLITARTAIEQGREVFAIPGSIHNPQAKGCHALIKQGAKLVESGQDVFEELIPQLQHSLHLEETTPVSASSSSQSPSSPLLQWIEFEPIGLDELAVLSKMPVSSLQAELLMLEISGYIEKLSAGRWQRLK
jgi:DNA processing protein